MERSAVFMVPMMYRLSGTPKSVTGVGQGDGRLIFAFRGGGTVRSAVMSSPRILGMLPRLISSIIRT